MEDQIFHEKLYIHPNRQSNMRKPGSELHQFVEKHVFVPSSFCRVMKKVCIQPFVFLVANYPIRSNVSIAFKVK